MQWIKYTFRYVCLGPLPSGVDLTILLSIILFIYLFYILFLQCNADVYCSNFNATLGAPFGATAFWAQICFCFAWQLFYYFMLCYVILFYAVSFIQFLWGIFSAIAHGCRSVVFLSVCTESVLFTGSGRWETVFAVSDVTVRLLLLHAVYPDLCQHLTLRKSPQLQCGERCSQSHSHSPLSSVIAQHSLKNLAMDKRGHAMSYSSVLKDRRSRPLCGNATVS